MATTTGSQTSTPRGPRQPQTAPQRSRLRAIAWIVGPTLAVFLAFAVLWATVLRDPAPNETADPGQAEEPAPAGVPEEPVGDAPGVNEPEATPLTPEEEAAADVEARLLEYERVRDEHYADPPDRYYPDGLPIDTVSAGLLREGTVGAYNDVALVDQPLQAIIGSTALVALEVTNVDLYDEPRTVNDREGVAGVATVDVCRDVSQLTPVDAAGAPVEDTAGRFVMGRYELSLQPNPGSLEAPAEVLWYVVDGRTLWYSDETDLPSDEIVAACSGTVVERDGEDA